MTTKKSHESTNKIEKTSQTEVLKTVSDTKESAPQIKQSVTPNNETELEQNKTKEADQAKVKEALRSQELLHLNLGYIAGLFSNSKYHVKASIGHFMSSVIPALKHNQFKIFFNGFKPVAYVSWAMLSDEVQEKYKSGKHLLAIDEWKSGDNVWLAEFVVPYSAKDRDVVIKNLKEKILQNKTINIITRNPDGSVKSVIKDFEE
jgi:cytolysin-activating lysine-acyltransferase